MKSNFFSSILPVCGFLSSHAVAKTRVRLRSTRAWQEKSVRKAWSSYSVLYVTKHNALT